MPAYITTINVTDQGMRSMKDNANMAQAFNKMIETAGARKIGIWFTMGQSDAVAVIDAPDDATMTKILLMLGMSGNVRTSTVRAFSEDEMAAIMKGLG